MNDQWRKIAALVIVALLASLWGAAAVTPARAETCTELVVDGGFETGGSWQLGVSPVPPQVVTYASHSPTHSLQLGITGGANVESFSSARQTVTIPAGASQATLSFWFYAMAEAPATTDYMELALLSADGSAILGKPWWSHNDSRLWNLASFDLSAWRGQTIQLYFNVYNDGLGGRAAMFLDDVSLSTCLPPAPPVTGTATRTPTSSTATPTPTSTPGCRELLGNGAFTGGFTGWDTSPGVPGGVGLATIRYRSAPYSLKLGSLEASLVGEGVARQLVTIPAGVATVSLDFWLFTQSQPLANSDYQRVAVLDAEGALLDELVGGIDNNNAWAHYTFDLTAYAGQTVFLSFAVNNDGTGGRTAMYVDDVRLTACGPGPLATLTPTPTRTRTPTGSPAPTVPAGCTGLTRNGGFESGSAEWTAGRNPLPPVLVTDPVFDGSFSVQLGSQFENLDAYSSIRQTVTVPLGYARTFVSFWAWTWAESFDGSDRQQFVLLGPGDVVWSVPWKVLEDEQTWQPHMFELLGVAGHTFDLYFAAVNDGEGGRTALFLDEVQLWGCAGDAFPVMAAAPPDTGVEALAFEAGASPEAIPVPDVYPVETLPASESFTAAGATAQPAGESRAVAEAPPVPGPDWTEVAIAGAGVTPAPAQLARAVEEMPPAAAATLAPAAVPAQPANFVQRATANWPKQWPWVVGGILILFLLVMLFVGTRASGG